MALLVDTEKLSEYQKNMESELTDLRNNVNNYKNVVNEIGNYWSGRDHTNFDTKVTDFLKELYKVLDYIQESNDYLDNYITATKDLDNRYTSSKITISQK